MDEIEFFNMLLDELRFQGFAIPNVAYRQRTAPVPAHHYHCRCCGGIVIPKGTHEHFPWRWLRAVVNLAGITRRGFNHVAHDVYRIIDETVREVAAMSVQARTQPGPRHGPTDEHEQVSVWLDGESMGVYKMPVKPGKTAKPVASPKPSVARPAKSHELVKPVKSVEPVQSTDPAQSAEAIHSVEPIHLSGPADPVKDIPPKDETRDEEVTLEQTQQVLKSTTPEPTYIDQKKWGTSNDSPIKPRIKAKLRRQSEGIPSISSPTPTPQDQKVTAPTPALPVLPSRIEVSPTSLQTLTRLFSSNPKNKKLLHFNEIVAALEDAGLTAKRGGRCQGSAVVFKNRKGEGTITFHCPHPEPKIEFHKQRTWGTRLQNKFGWELETFVEKVG